MFDHQVWFFLTLNVALLLAFSWCGLQILNYCLEKGFRRSAHDGSLYRLQARKFVSCKVRKYLLFRKQRERNAEDDEPPCLPARLVIIC